MKEEAESLVACFEYLKKYFLDILDALEVMLRVILIGKKNPEIFTLNTHDKVLEFCLQKDRDLQLSIPLANGIKLNKVLKFLKLEMLESHVIEEFFHIIAQQKTHNKLYEYSTPMEVNRLLIGLLELQEGEQLYNPCYGMGSVFLSLKKSCITLFGEELDLRLARIAHWIVKICALDGKNLYVNDLLKTPKFVDADHFRKFDKILCNPPVYAHMGEEFFKKDARFTLAPTMAKRYPELVFLIHSLSHLKKRGVFIVRNQVLQKSGVEARVREMLCKERLIHAIIELPKNVFPLQNHDFSIIVIAPHSHEILHINANTRAFYYKDGKYNRLKGIDKLLEVFAEFKPSAFSSLTPLSSINALMDLRASVWVGGEQPNSGMRTVRSIGFEVLRGQRVYGGDNDEEIAFFDVGIADFSALGYTCKFENKRNKGDRRKIEKYALRPYDILFSLRGNTPKVTILGEIEGLCVANAGLGVLRCKDPQKAIGLYCYFFTKKGEEALGELYGNDGILNITKLLEISLPKRLPSKLMESIIKLSEKQRQLGLEIADLKNQ